jgi:hypothetical protein
MSTAPAVGDFVQSIDQVFSYEKWNALLLVLARQYRVNKPCPHVLIKDFLEPATALAMAAQFPRATSEAWTQYKHANENKLGMAKRHRRTELA